MSATKEELLAFLDTEIKQASRRIHEGNVHEYEYLKGKNPLDPGGTAIPIEHRQKLADIARMQSITNHNHLAMLIELADLVKRQ